MMEKEERQESSIVHHMRFPEENFPALQIGGNSGTAVGRIKWEVVNQSNR